MSLASSRPLRILAFWHGFEFETLFSEMFLNHPDFEFEIVCGGKVRSGIHRLSHARLWKLFQKTQDRHFDLILASNIYKSLWPCNKRLATRLANFARFTTIHLHRTDTCWAPFFAAKTKVPMAAIDFRDVSFVLSSDWPLLREATLYFKRELFHWPQKSLLPLGEIINFETLRPHAAKLRPFSWGTPATSLSHLNEKTRSMEDRDIDLFMSGTGNPIRQELFRRCQALAKKYPHLRIVANDQFISDEAYRAMLQRAKIVLCPESHACDNHRQYDVAAAGAVPAINWPNTQSHRPFLPDIHAIYFSLMGDDFEKKIISSLADLKALQTIATAAKTFVKIDKDRKTMARTIVDATLAEAQSTRAA